MKVGRRGGCEKKESPSPAHLPSDLRTDLRGRRSKMGGSSFFGANDRSLRISGSSSFGSEERQWRVLRFSGPKIEDRGGSSKIGTSEESRGPGECWSKGASEEEEGGPSFFRPRRWKMGRSSFFRIEEGGSPRS